MTTETLRILLRLALDELLRLSPEELAAKEPWLTPAMVRWCRRNLRKIVWEDAEYLELRHLVHAAAELLRAERRDPNEP